MGKNPFKLIMISSMYENGGNTTHRLLDGHPQLYVYPFESQPGTKYVNDFLSSMFPLKYRWPIFPNSLDVSEIYDMIIDEEGKIRAKTPFVSKFRNVDFNFSDDERKKIFVGYLKSKSLSRPNIMEAFFVATFKAWKNYNITGKEKAYVGYSPIIGVDGDKIINDYNGNASVLHVIRNPFSGYAETKKRPVPLSLEHYVMAWIICQYYALRLSGKYKKNFYIIKYEDIIKNPEIFLGEILIKMGFQKSSTLAKPSWNGKLLKEIYPWGTIKIPSEKVNIETAKTLSKLEISEIYSRTKMFLEKLNYKNIFKILDR